MALGGTYTTGTVTILAITPTIVTGIGTLWSPVIEEGDWLFIAGQTGIIASVDSDTQLTLETPWITPFPSGASYVILKNSWLRYDPAITQAKVRELLVELDALTPATSTLNAITRFGSADGKLLKNSLATINDSGFLTLGGGGYGQGALQSSAAGLITANPIDIITGRASNTMLVAGDRGRHIIASASFVQTFDTPANLGAHWWCRFRNASANACVLSTSSGTFVGGGSSGIALFPVYPDEDLLIACDGVNFFVSGASGRVFIASRTAASSPSIAFTDIGLASAGFRFKTIEYEIIGLLPVTDNVSLQVRWSFDNGSIFQTAGYAHARAAAQVGASNVVAGGSDSDSAIILGGSSGNVSNEVFSGIVRQQSGVNLTTLTWSGGYILAIPSNNVGVSGYGKAGFNANATAFFYAAGNIASGTIRCYGLV